MDKKTFALAALIILLAATIAQAAYATWVSRAFKIGDAKDINLNGQAIGNGIISGSDTSVSGASCGAGQYITISGSTWSCGTPAMNLVNASGDMKETYSTYGRQDYMMYASVSGDGVIIQNQTNISLYSPNNGNANYIANVSYTPNSLNLIGQFNISNITSPVTTYSFYDIKIGFKSDWNAVGFTQCVCFGRKGNGTSTSWYAITDNTTSDNISTAITINNRDKLSIVVNSTSAKYYVNSVLVWENQSVPTTGLSPGAKVIGSTNGPVYFNINYFGFTKY